MLQDMIHQYSYNKGVGGSCLVVMSVLFHTRTTIFSKSNKFTLCTAKRMQANVTTTSATMPTATSVQKKKKSIDSMTTCNLDMIQIEPEN